MVGGLLEILITFLSFLIQILRRGGKRKFVRSWISFFVMQPRLEKQCELKTCNRCYRSVYPSELLRKGTEVYFRSSEYSICLNCTSSSNLKHLLSVYALFTSYVLCNEFQSFVKIFFMLLRIQNVLVQESQRKRRMHIPLWLFLAITNRLISQILWL